MKYLPILLLLIGCSCETKTVAQKGYTGEMELTVALYQAEVKLDYGDYVDIYNIDEGIGYTKHRKILFSRKILQDRGLIDDDKPYMAIRFDYMFRINKDLTESYKKKDGFLEYVDVKSNKCIILPINKRIEIYRQKPKIYVNNKLWDEKTAFREFYFNNCNHIIKIFPLTDIEIYDSVIMVTFE